MAVLDPAGDRVEELTHEERFARDVRYQEKLLRDELENDPRWLRSDRDSWKQLAQKAQRRADIVESVLRGHASHLMNDVHRLIAADREAHRAA